MFDKDDHPLSKLEFPKSKADWQNAPANFSRERLEIYGHPVMERWEKPYMEKLAEIATSKSGVVLEVGFGLGISAGYIQQHNIDAHYIIEANAQVFTQVELFARDANHEVIPLFGFWEDVVHTLPDEGFDGILFDTYPITEGELHTARFAFFGEAYRLLKRGGVFTLYAGEVEYTPTFRSLLNKAGFTNISGELFPVSPPADCLYWNEDVMLAPVIVKD
jgi:guanidinoacetate N-methyltransferase